VQSAGTEVKVRPALSVSVKVTSAGGGAPVIVAVTVYVIVWPRTTGVPLAGDADFKAMMHDFVKSNFNRDVSTEDFKHAVEKYMTPGMNLGGDGTMSWFFDQWVYGTEVPKYAFEYSLKEQNATTYTRYDYTAWGEPIRTNGFAADARWFGSVPETIATLDGAEAARLIPKIRQVIENYRFRSYGDYNAWPGPNSNTFVQAVLDAVPELRTVLPPTAIGKDYPYRGEWFGLTPSGTGAYASMGGYLGLTIGWVEGLEINFLGAVVGLDIRRPALKLPGIGRLGMMAGI
jgi:hypothetical protein